MIVPPRLHTFIMDSTKQRASNCWPLQGTCWYHANRCYWNLLRCSVCTNQLQYFLSRCVQHQNMNIKITHPRLFMFFILLWPCNYKLNFTNLTTQNTTHLVSIMSYSKSLDGQKYLIILIDLISNIYTMFFLSFRRLFNRWLGKPVV